MDVQAREDVHDQLNTSTTGTCSIQLYTFDRTSGYEALECVDTDSWLNILLHLDGSSHTATWKPFQVRRIAKARKRPFRASDSPYEIHDVLFFRRPAVDVLRDILDAYGELLPVEDEVHSARHSDVI